MLVETLCQIGLSKDCVSGAECRFVSLPSWPQQVPVGTSAEPLLPWPDPCPLDLDQIMGETLKDPVIKRCCEAPNRLKDLHLISDGLEKCQKSLNDYLDSKRNAFPRFFFISDDELLSILGSSDPLCVQEHMIKVGPGGLAGRGARAGLCACGWFSPGSPPPPGVPQLRGCRPKRCRRFLIN